MPPRPWLSYLVGGFALLATVVLTGLVWHHPRTLPRFFTLVTDIVTGGLLSVALLPESRIYVAVAARLTRPRYTVKEGFFHQLQGAVRTPYAMEAQWFESIRHLLNLRELHWLYRAVQGTLVSAWVSGFSLSLFKNLRVPLWIPLSVYGLGQGFVKVHGS